MSAELELETPRLHRLSALAAAVGGNVLEFYDFLSFGFFAVSIARVMFPAGAPGVGLLLTLMTGSMGYFARPAGAVVFGMLGDRIGRRPVMLITFSLMGVGAAGMALTPTYAQIGFAAPGLVVLFRLIQGMAAGGDVGPTSAYLAEAGPAWSRGSRICLQYVAMRAGALLGGLVGLAVASLMPPSALDALGWRLAFGLGAVIVPFAFCFRNRIEETLYQPEIFSGAIVRVKLGAYLASLVAVFTGLWAIGLCDFFYTFAVTWLHAPQREAYWITISICAVQVFFSVLGGRLVDRFGGAWIMAAPWALGLLLAFPLFSWAFAAGGALRFALAGATVAALAQLGAVAALISFVASTPKKTRSGLIGVGYAVAVAAGIGIGPPLVAQLITQFKTLDVLALAFVASFTLGLGSVGAALLAGRTSSLAAGGGLGARVARDV